MKISRHREDGFIGFRVFWQLGGKGFGKALDLAIPTDGMGYFKTAAGTRVYTVLGFAVERGDDYTAILAFAPFFAGMLMIAKR